MAVGFKVSTWCEEEKMTAKEKENPTNTRRDLDVRPFGMIAGLNRNAKPLVRKPILQDTSSPPATDCPQK